jgi:hypothetical protein
VVHLAPGDFFPTRNRRIDIERVDLDAKAAAAGALGGEKRRAAAAKGIKHDVSLLRRIEQRVSDERNRLDGRMQFKSRLCPLRGKPLALV